MRRLPEECARVIRSTGRCSSADRAHRRHLGEKDFTRYLIIRIKRGVPSLDATGMNALENLYDYCSANGVSLIFSHVNEQPMKTMRPPVSSDLVGRSTSKLH